MSYMAIPFNQQRPSAFSCDDDYVQTDVWHHDFLFLNVHICLFGAIWCEHGRKGRCSPNWSWALILHGHSGGSSPGATAGGDQAGAQSDAYWHFRGKPCLGASSRLCRLVTPRVHQSNAEWSTKMQCGVSVVMHFGRCCTFEGTTA